MYKFKKDFLMISPSIYKHISISIYFYTTVLLAFTMFIPGIAFATRIGEYLIQLFSDFGIDFPIIIVAFSEVMCVSYVYGLDK